MNIYFNVEISVRELDSKLLLGTLAASRGHQVIISDMSGIDRALRKKLIAPGIFHTKCITPIDEKINFHQAMINNGFLITSIDEEAGLDMYGYEEFSKTRYSEQTMRQASAVFCWGDEDVEVLKKVYPNHASKIYKTCSPRVDLWKSDFLEYWKSPKGTPKKPFLLVPSNMGMSNYNKPFYEFIKFSSSAGYYKRDPKLFKNHFGCASEDYLKTHSFIEAIRHLSNNNDYDIVLRPHPIEDIEAWKVYLKDIPNVHVIREGSITPWVNNSFAVMHNGCTTGFEAIVSRKPLITYVPFDLKFSPTLTNGLGHRVKTLNELSNIVDKFFKDSQSGKESELVKTLPNLILKKVFLDQDELAAKKIIKIWESLDNGNLSGLSNWKMLRRFLNILELKDTVGYSLRKITKKKFTRYREDNKFSPLDKKDIFCKVKKLVNLLKINRKLDCHLLSKRTILIKPNELI